MAGRLGKDERGNLVIFLIDKGVAFIEASVDSALDHSILLKPSPILLNFHPSFQNVDDLIQIQITRFTCGSMIIGFTIHHRVADGRSASHFLVAWSQATRGLGVMNPFPFRDNIIVIPRNPPIVEFEHEGAEFISKRAQKEYSLNGLTPYMENDVVVEKFHFTGEFITKLKAIASSKNCQNRPFSTFQSIVAHLWRVMTRAGYLDCSETTQIRIAVDGRMRLIPRVPNGYFGNLVLWAFPTAQVKDLLREPLPYAATLIYDAIAKINNDHFRSFIDFANYELIEKDLIPTADMNTHILCPNLEVDSWLSFPSHDLEFGTEGMLLLMPSSTGEGGIDAFIPIFKDNLSVFKKYCYSPAFMQIENLHSYL